MIKPISLFNGTMGGVVLYRYFQRIKPATINERRTKLGKMSQLCEGSTIPRAGQCVCSPQRQDLPIYLLYLFLCLGTGGESVVKGFLSSDSSSFHKAKWIRLDSTGRILLIGSLYPVDRKEANRIGKDREIEQSILGNFISSSLFLNLVTSLHDPWGWGCLILSADENSQIHSI